MMLAIKLADVDEVVSSQIASMDRYMYCFFLFTFVVSGWVEFEEAIVWFSFYEEVLLL